MLVSLDALGVVVGAHAWCGGSRVHLILGFRVRRRRPTLPACNEVTLVAPSADQGMQGLMWSLADRKCLPEDPHVRENGGV